MADDESEGSDAAYAADADYADAAEAAELASMSLGATRVEEEGAGANGFTEGGPDSDPDPNARALAAARSQLEQVSQELFALKHRVEEEYLDSVPLDVRELQRAVRHLQVDCEQARLRASRLHNEKELLLATQAQLQAELRETRRSLEDALRRLHHREIDLQHLTGRVPEDPDTLADEADLLAASSQERSQSSVQRADSGDGRADGHLSKHALLKSLWTAQDELEEVRRRQEKLERRSQKDRERLMSLLELAERQRNEILVLRKRAAISEVFASESEHRLKAHPQQRWGKAAARPAPSAHSKADALSAGAAAFSALRAEVRADLECGSSGCPAEGHQDRPGPTSFRRQQWLPTRLPSVKGPKR